ncbi:unnamed protein product, partial [Polarella glacialis]
LHIQGRRVSDVLGIHLPESYWKNEMTEQDPYCLAAADFYGLVLPKGAVLPPEARIPPATEIGRWRRQGRRRPASASQLEGGREPMEEPPPRERRIASGPREKGAERIFMVL